MNPRPGRDRRAVLHRGRAGETRARQRKQVCVIGGGIAGIAAATVLRERGVEVTLVEAADRLGGRVAAWPLGSPPGPQSRTMSRGFHAFFRQYYNLRALLSRVDPALAMLRPIADYPLQRPDGMRDSFRSIPKTPPWSVLGFVAQSPTFTPATLARVNVAAALELLRVGFPDTYPAYDGESAAAFLDRLRFPADARDLALEVFARSFFADPEAFAAGELVAMFHTYFLGSAEGLLFDVPRDDYDTSLWAPLGRHLTAMGTNIRTRTRVTAIEGTPGGVRVNEDEFDAAVIATDPGTARELVAGIRTTDDRLDPRIDAWQRRVAATGNAPPFVVVRLWYDGFVRPDRGAFVGTSGYGPLDNVSVLERFEDGAARWSRERAGSVVELHAYAVAPRVMDDAAAREGMAEELVGQLHRIYPETAALAVRHREVLVRDDCPLIGPERWADRPGVETPLETVMLAGDWVRCDYPVALMERAATTGFLAANELLHRWGAAEVDLWTVPMRGLLGPLVRRRRTGECAHRVSDLFMRDRRTRA